MGKLEEMRVVELRSELKKRGLSSIGRKSDLLERLKPVLKEESKTHDDSESSASHAKTTKTQDQVAKKKPIEVREDIPKTQQPLVVQKPIEKRIESSKEIPKPSNVEVESKAAQPQKEIKSPEHQKEEPQPPKEIKRLEVKKAEALSESEVVSENAPRRKLVRQQQSPTDGQTTLTVMKQRIVPASKKTDSVVKPKTTAPDGAAAAQKERARMEEELRLRAKLSLTQRRLKKLGQDSPKSTKQPSESTSGTDMTSQALTSDEMQALLDMPSTSSTKPPAVPQDEQKDAAAQPQGMQEDADAQEVQADVKVQTDEESEKKLQKLSDRNKKIAASRIIRQKQTESVRIDGFILPLTKEEVQNKLEEFGNVTLFCMADHLKYCYATFESKKEASAAIQALNRVPWPKPKRPPLTVRFVPNAAVEEAHKKSEEKQARHAKLKRTREESGEHEEEEDKADDASPRVERVGSLDTEPDAQDEVSQPPRKRKVLVVKKKVHQEESGASTHEGSRVSNHRSREPEQFNLDVLFRKTRTEPCIYWLPLTEEEILEKQRGGGTTQPWHAHSSDGDRRGMRGRDFMDQRGRGHMDRRDDRDRGRGHMGERRPQRQERPHPLLRDVQNSGDRRHNSGDDRRRRGSHGDRDDRMDSSWSLSNQAQGKRGSTRQDPNSRREQNGGSRGRSQRRKSVPSKSKSRSKSSQRSKSSSSRSASPKKASASPG